MTPGQKLVFKADTEQIEIKKQFIISAELGNGILGSTLVTITLSPGGLAIVNKFMSKNLNKEMDLLFGKNIISNSVTIRTDHVLKDLTIAFHDKDLARKFYDEFKPQR